MGAKKRRGLGRRKPPDRDKDESYPLRALLPKRIDRDRRYWFSRGWTGDQGSTSQCVAYSWTHWIEDGPVGHPGKAPLFQPKRLYDEAQKVDEWPGEGYDGTSVRAGAKVLQSWGLISEYRWAFDADTILDALLTTGPVVIGVNWYASFFEPDADGFIGKGEDWGSIEGGHAVILNGANRTRGVVRGKNSWGAGWGVGGAFWLPLEALDRLIKEDGEAALAAEVKGSGSIP